VSGGLTVAGPVRVLTEAAPGRIEWLEQLGMRFDHTPDGALALGREAGHHQRRIVHAGGDATGAELARAMGKAVRAKGSVEVLEGVTVLDLVWSRGSVVGVLARQQDESITLMLAPAVVLATGGIGRVYARTTNPASAYGGGLAMAARAGARLIDLEFVQFHPTALAGNIDPAPLFTEALRGEGALLIDELGERFMPAEHPDAELAPRDVIARAIYQRIKEVGGVYLDATGLDADVLSEFATLTQHAAAVGLDPRVDPLPVSPAAHYFMGGIAVNIDGRSSIPGLWAVGEVSSTGVHGANRLASNSLLEGLVFGDRAARDIVDSAVGWSQPTQVQFPLDTAEAAADSADLERSLRSLMWSNVGVVRDEAGLHRAISQLRCWTADSAPVSSRTRDMLVVARLIAAAVLARRESRGAHYRSNFRRANPILEQRRAIAPAPAPAVSLALDAVESRGFVPA
jgi:L-aspartate oxidase